MSRILLALLAFSVAVHAQAQPYRIVGYVGGRDAGDTWDAGKVDTLIFSFAKVAGGEVVLDAEARSRLHKVLALKAGHPQLRVSISVGGWGAGGFSEAAASAEGRRRFARSAAALLRAEHADGLDVDWEYPGHHESGIASSEHDRENFTALLAETRAALDDASAQERRAAADRYRLSIAVADAEFVDHVDIAAVDAQIDWFNLMTYDFVNAMTPTTGHHSGLYASAWATATARTGERAVKQFLAAGVAPRKLFLGAAFYGREFDGVDPAHDGVYQHFGSFVGYRGWKKLKQDYIDKQGYARHWDADAHAPFLWNKSTRHFVSYEDAQSLREKIALVRSNRLGGIMYWEQGEDPEGELLQVLARGLSAASGNP
ncbi:MAG: chitinase [Rudaea sp.]|uniref:glycoside hydrolase family 18 protein n=1 Tax=unclassified Rudaea TaxID=2627037 RepID=UPI0010F5D906|nr:MULTISPECIES: glycosyl hydrolase family 18 protein [unclassified Rudaea]MBN8888343.1 chitinase [Rudaea sp.]